MDRISTLLVARSPRGTKLHAFLLPILSSFLESGCADANYLTELESGDEGQFWSRVWEGILYRRFNDLGWRVSGNGEGPDCHLETPAGKVLVEATVPSPDGLPSNWLEEHDGVYSMPYEQMLLRWTSKIADKQRKHLEDTAAWRVSGKTPFVIAVNSCRLARFPEENGISQWPFAVEAVFPIGPLAVPVNVATGKFGQPYQSLRFSIRKREGVEIPTDNFLNPEYAHVSALLGCAACYEKLPAEFLGLPPMFLVHNPLAANPLPLNWLPGAIEYAATQSEPDEFTLSRLTPRES